MFSPEVKKGKREQFASACLEDSHMTLLNFSFAADIFSDQNKHLWKCSDVMTNGNGSWLRVLLVIYFALFRVCCSYSSSFSFLKYVNTHDKTHEQKMVAVERYVDVIDCATM